MAWFTDKDLRRLAGPTSYERAGAYLTAVGPVDELPDGVTAVVEGTEPYDVRLRDDDGELAGECTCPYGMDGAFCKHCVAVGLTVLAAGPAPRGAAVDVRGYLTSLDHAALVDLLLGYASEDPALHRRLSLRAATHGTPDVAGVRRLADGLRTHGYLGYGQSFGYARKADDVLDALADLDPASAGPLYRLVIGHLTETVGEADDSAGVIGDSLDRAVAGYAKACRAAPPDPVELAHWLIDTQLDDGADIDIADFAEALGATGLEAYRQRLGELAGSRDFTVRHLREEYVRTIAGDVDALVAVYAEELPQAYAYVRIGDALRDAGRPAEAVAWLRRGLAEADRPDDRIDLMLAELLTAAGEHAQALDVHWRLFTAAPGRETHRRLLSAAARAGTTTETSGRAVAHLHETAARGGHHADPLVEVLLETGEVDEAWIAAHRYACGAAMLYRVAAARARTHPAEAIPILLRRAEELIGHKTKAAYAEAAELVRDLRTLHKRAGQDFTPALRDITERHRRKTSFLAEFDRAGLRTTD